MATPSFEQFTNEQLEAIVALQNPAQTESAKKVLSQRVTKEPSGVDEGNPTHESDVDKASPAGASTRDRHLPAAKTKKSRKEWDQFEANERLFGVKPEFNINEYTSDIDRSAPGYKELEEKSLKIAREILSQSTIDLHRLEERGIQRAAGVSEDRVYSTVDLEDRWVEPHTEEEKRSPAREIVCTASPQRAAILKELEEVEQTINDSKGVSDGWTGLVIQILSRKKSLIEKLQALDEGVKEPLGSPPPLAAEKKESVEAHPQSSRKSRNRESSRKSESATSFEMTFAPGVKVSLDENSRGTPGKNSRNHRNGSRKHQDGSRTAQSETKPSKQVVIGGGALEYANGHECIEAIRHNFRRKRSEEESRKWGNGPSIEDMYSVHMNPLDPFEIPPEKINDIVKAEQRDAEVAFRKHK